MSPRETKQFCHSFAGALIHTTVVFIKLDIIIWKRDQVNGKKKKKSRQDILPRDNI